MKKPIFDIKKHIKSDIWPRSEIQRQIDELDRRGKRFTIDKCILVFLHDEEVEGVYFDTLSYRIIIGKAPWRGEYQQESVFWGDNDSRCFCSFCSEKYLFRPLKNEAEEALFACTTDARNGRIVNSLRAYMNDVRGTWDGKERVGKILTEICGTPESPYSSEVMKKFMVGAVGRIYEPGKKFDNVLTLYGDQGSGKSSFSSLLAPGDEDFYASLDFSMMDDIKKTGELLQGKLVIELEEMGGLRKTSQKKVKSGISRKCDRYREAFNKFSDDHYRTCVFIGTVNPENDRGILTDMTGNRRYWPLKAPGKGLTYTQIKEAMDNQRDQLWAESIYYYDQGIEPILSQESEKEADKRRNMLLDVDHGMVETIMDYLNMSINRGKRPNGNEWIGQTGWFNIPVTNQIDFWEKYKAMCKENDIGEARTYSCVEEIWNVCLGNTKKPTRQESQQISSLFSSGQIPGWTYDGQTRKGCGVYGRQRVFERIEQ